MSDPRFWKIPKLFPGKTILLVATGPSMSDLDLEPAKGLCPTIAINNASITTAPWADFYFFGDNRWWRWYKDSIPASFPGRIITTSAAKFTDGRVLRINKEYNAPLSWDPLAVSGLDSGTIAINVAVLLGAKRIVLAGYDMAFAEDGRAHHHEDHPEPTREQHYIEKFQPQYPPLLAELAKHKIEIVRVTPSRLTMIPQMELLPALTGAPIP